MNLDVDKNTIFLTKHGSQAYGTNIATSDLDIKGVCIPTPEFTLGYAFNFEQQEQIANKGHEADKVVYGLQKFFKLAADCNPNIIEVLFTDDTDHLLVTEVGRTLLDNKDLFISKKAKHTFSGYAHAQLKRIEAKRRWITDPPKSQPKRENYGLVNKFDKLVDPVLEKQYKADAKVWGQYQHWLTNRNEKRFEWEVKYGYDVKHGMHLIRLMRMCKEILSGQGVIVKRPDAPYLLSIRAGEVPYEELLQEANTLQEECEELYVSSQLPRCPPVAKLNDLCMNMTLDHWNREL